jgi:hypothetical protein
MPRPSTLSEDYDPPAPWWRAYFGLAIRGGVRRRIRSVNALTNAELAWFGRIIAAEIERRRAKDGAGQKAGQKGQKGGRYGLD